ncbi:hypothetical protein MRB53_037076 [Persea americana]|nr:hypothetical protein MRB53_037076 [Persea americana]
MTDHRALDEALRPEDNIAAAFEPEPTSHAAQEPLDTVRDEKDLQLDLQDRSSSFSEREQIEKTEIGHTKDGKDWRARSMTRTETSSSGLSHSDRDIEKVDSKQVKGNHRWYRWITFQGSQIPPVPEVRTVCKEYKANVFSQYSFQWMSSMMSVGYQRPLEYNDIWLVNPDRAVQPGRDKLMKEFKMRVARGDKRPLLGAMYQTFKFEFILAGICQLVSSVLQVITPFVLKYLIQFATEAYEASHPDVLRAEGLPLVKSPPIGRGIGIVFGITIAQFVQSGCTNQALYRGMVMGGQCRSVLISIIFDKAMVLSGRAKAGGKARDLPGEEEQMPAGIKAGSKEEKAWFKKVLKKKQKSAPKGRNGVAGDGNGWGNGRIINLMSVDTYRIDQVSWAFHMIWTSPVAILITLALLLVNLTYSALAGFGLLVCAMPVLATAIKSLFSRRQAINKITDQRVSLTQEILSAVRFVKFFGWEGSFLERLSKIRDREINRIQWLLAIRNAITAVAMSMPIFASMLAFITYALSGHDVSSHNGGAATVFSSLALFNSLRLPLNLLPMIIGQAVDALSSVGRIQEFLLAEEANDEAVWDNSSEAAVVMANGSFTWERAANKDKNKDVVDVHKSKKQVKEDEKEAKKAAKQEKKDLKQAKKTGTITSSPSDSASTLVEEKPFTINDLNFSVARNELVAVIGGVGSGKSSLLAALAGDMRKTGGGITLGSTRAFCPQYAWIQNATFRENILFGKEYDPKWYNQVVKACALEADIDMLPYGDATEIGERGITVSGGQKQRLNIARAIYFASEIVLMDDPLSAVDAHVGRHIMDQAICGLLKNKCRILATHQLWVLNRVDRIIWMEAGSIQAIGTYDELMASNPDFVKLVASNAQEEKREEQEDAEEDEVEEEKKDMKKKTNKKAAALMQTEERAVKAVDWGVYKAYVKASGSLMSMPFIVATLVLSQGANIATSLWLSWWTSDKFHKTRGEYIGIYAALGVIQALLMFAFSITLTIYGTRASKAMLRDAITHVLRAPMSFFDTTPLGRITNRFSKDIDVMDNTLTDSIRFFFMTMAQIISVFILIIAYFYYFAVALGPLILLFLFSASFYRASAREIKRHESVLRSVVFARFSEAVSGISTIRAYGLGEHFSKTIREAIDDMDSAYFLTFSNQRWLSTRLDAIGNLLVFVLGILVVTSRFTVNPATGGLVLSYILSIVQMIQFTVRQLAEVENNMNSTERIHYYGTQLEQEPPPYAAQVPPEWPQRGEIVFKDVEMRYRDGLPLVLQGLSMHVKGGERIGVVGRTGAGKSSIMSTLFRLVDVSAGSIIIDGVDISTVGLADLRSRLAIIPQDPTLFRGTIRSNLDPFNRYTDLELWSALRQADLVSNDATIEDRTSSAIHLDSSVDEEGLNFSLGQRQLMALARALVRGAQIIVCDEATSSVDMATDAKVQRTMATGFKGKTLLCIAHRLKTIVNYDRICVMDKGRIAELDTPIALWEKGGIFRSMCDRGGIGREDFEDQL